MNTLDIDIIKSTGLLSDDDSNRLSELVDELQQNISTQIIWRTYTEAVCSVLNDMDCPTAAAKYHQANREQFGMFEQLVLTSFDYRKALINLEETEEKLLTSEGYAKRRLEVKRDELLFRIKNLQLQAKDRIREIQMWSEIKQSLDNGSFDTSNKDTDELISLTLRYCQELPIALHAKQDVAAARNIIGQAATLLRECKKRGIMNKIGPIGTKSMKMLSIR